MNSLQDVNHPSNRLITTSKPARIAGMVGSSNDDPPGAPQGANVVPLVPPMSRARATEIVREVVKAGRASIMVMHAGATKGAVPNSRQIDSVLRDGQILEDHVEFDGRSYYRFRMLRVCAGTSVEVEVALEALASLPRLFVTRAKGDAI
jgi:hypothetical protein